MTKPRTRNSSTLEREVILAVMVLYALICATMLSIHYLSRLARKRRPRPPHRRTSGSMKARRNLPVQRARRSGRRSPRDADYCRHGGEDR